jgi:peptidyl-prolyl cis-trans isomerase C
MGLELNKFKPLFMKSIYIQLFLLLSLVSVAMPISAQTKKSSNSANVYATVGDGVITKDVFDQAIKEAINAGRQDSPQLRNEIRNILINQELLVQEALKQGLDKNPEHRRAIQNLRQNYYVQLMLRESLKNNPVTEEQIRQEYEQRFNSKLIASQLDYKITSWIFSSEKEATALIDRLGKGDSIEKAEKTLAIRKEQRSNQDIWVAQGNLAKPVLDVIVYLSKGAHSLKPIQIGGAWHVIRLEDQRPMRAPKYDEIKGALANTLVEKRQTEYLSSLRTKVTINITP